ncbi:unnamed protein product, partial [Mesorhabditis belari]|uniref:Uncharacterized protein n=1 Tax=Mesorhabditis belari TaxID=2138241 RepID=A0AAF3F700_9BILA
MVFGHNESDKRVLKVYNGGEVMNHYPFMAAIFINTSKGWMYACGGTVIAREWISQLHIVWKRWCSSQNASYWRKISSFWWELNESNSHWTQLT